MKKSIKLLAGVLCAIMTAIVFMPSYETEAANTAQLTGPSELRAGDTFTVMFKISGTGLTGVTCTLQYDSTQLTLNSWKKEVMSKWEVEEDSGNFIVYDNSGENPISSTNVFSLSFTAKKTLNVGDNVTISLKDVVLTDGKKDTKVGTISFSKVILAPKSDDNDLKTLSVNGFSLDPGFSQNRTTYSLSVPYETSKISVTATANDSKAKVSIDSPSLKVNGHTNVTIKVTSESGQVKRYVIDVFRAQDPNYVCSTVSSLKSLSVEGFLISPMFDPERLEYEVWLPYETTSLSVTAEPTDKLAQNVTYETASDLSVGETIIHVTCTAEDNLTQTTYAIKVYRANHPDEEDITVPVFSENTNLSAVFAEVSHDGETFVSSLFAFKEGESEFWYEIDQDVVAVRLEPQTEDEKATAQVLGNLSPKKGETVDVTILVVAESGVSKLYTVHMTRLGEETPMVSLYWALGVGGAITVCAVMLTGALAAISRHNSRKKKRSSNETK